MNLADFDAMTPEEFTATVTAANQIDETRLHDEWERTRLLATVLVQPYSKKKLRPSDVFSLPWDGRIQKKSTEKAPRSTKERFEELVRYFENKDKKNGK